MKPKRLDVSTKRQLISYLASFISPQRFSKMQEVVEKRTRFVTVVLEDIYQSHNASAVLRTAECFGVQDVYVIENRNTYKINPDVAVGAFRWIHLHRFFEEENNTERCLRYLREQGYQIVATTPHEEDVSLSDFFPQRKTAFLFGSEMEGLSQVALRLSDLKLRIPMVGFTESLNLSVSAALVLFHVLEKLRKSSLPWQLTEEEKLDVLLHWLRQSLRHSEELEKRFLEQLSQKPF